MTLYVAYCYAHVTRSRGGHLFRDLFDPSGLTPHGFCLLWQPGLIWLHALSDAAIALAYFSIPVALAAIVRRRRDLEFGWIYLVFAAFIMSCGVTHVMSIVTLWIPVYQIEGLIKALTAVLSIIAAVAVWVLMPQLLALPSPTALQESEARLHDMLIKLPAALCSLDNEGRLTVASDYMADLLDRERGDIIGRKLTDFVPPGQQSSGRDALSLTVLTGEIRELEGQLVSANGAVLDVLISTRLRQLGGSDNVLTVVTDVTARRRAESALRDSEERLRQSQKMEAIGKLTGGIAHDFNNMLTIIDGNLDQLRDRLRHDPKGQHLIEEAGRASHRADALIEQLLAFSRKQRLDPQALDARAVVAGMHSLLSRIAGEQITLTMSEGAPCWCVADRNQFEAGLINLVINASHAVSERLVKERGRTSGSIQIMITESPLQPGEWSDGGEAPSPGPYVRVSVLDDGIGMSDEVRSRAFEPFFTTRSVGKGSGLGLSQTYGFVHQSGGAMRIESQVGAGTLVEMALPRAPGPPSSMSDTTPIQSEFRSTGETLLVVEDEPAVLEIAAVSLRESGFAVVSASDAASALAALAVTPDVALVFTDIVMPGQSGIALANEIWKIKPGMPVVFASGYSEETLTRELPPGAKFVKKPYKISHVVDLIRASLTQDLAEV